MEHHSKGETYPFHCFHSSPGRASFAHRMSISLARSIKVFERRMSRVAPDHHVHVSRNSNRGLYNDSAARGSVVSKHSNESTQCTWQDITRKLAFGPFEDTTKSSMSRCHWSLAAAVSNLHYTNVFVSLSQILGTDVGFSLKVRVRCPDAAVQ